MNLSEKQLQKIIKQEIKEKINTNLIIHFLLRTGEDKRHGHWAYVGYVPKTHPQTGLYYINNVNGFSKETKFVTENLQNLVYKALNK